MELELESIAGEARVWNIFNTVGVDGIEQYLDYAQGYNLTNRMPLFVKPKGKLSLTDTMHAMRTHFEVQFIYLMMSAENS